MLRRELEQQGPHLSTGIAICESHYICRYIKKTIAIAELRS